MTDDEPGRKDILLTATGLKEVKLCGDKTIEDRLRQVREDFTTHKIPIPGSPSEVILGLVSDPSYYIDPLVFGVCH